MKKSVAYTWTFTVLCLAHICHCFGYHDSKAFVVFQGLLLPRQTFKSATCYCAVVTFCYVGNNSNGYTMEDSESISVLSEGGAVINPYGSIVVS